MRSDGAPIRAAGAVLWRPSRKYGIRIAVVHRPRYDDWSLPKGKAMAGETAPVTAWREVLEETGFRCILGRALTTVSYSVGGREKTVQYFAARRLTGAFEVNKEVDRLEWLPAAHARARMSYEFDRAVLDTFSLTRPDLTGVLLVRHGRAGHRESFEGDDVDRPLDAKGRKQAAALVGQLRPFGPGEVHSAPLERCTATIAPLARALGRSVVLEPLLAEDAYRDDPAAARRRLVVLAAAASPPPRVFEGGSGQISLRVHDLARAAAADGDSALSLVACSQGGVIPGVVKSLAARSDVPVAQVSTPKGSFWFLSFDGPSLVQADPYPSPAV